MSEISLNYDAVEKLRVRSTVAQIMISEKGQIRFNTIATQKLLEEIKLNPNEVKKIYFGGFDSEKRKLTMGFKPFKGQTDKDGWNVGWSDKVKQYQVSAAPILKAIKYDFVTSGNQRFNVAAGKGLIQVVVPEGSLEAKPKVERKKKAVKGDVVAEPKNAAQAATEQNTSEDILIEA